jgi:predicted RNase H-like HicB family nuclease
MSIERFLVIVDRAGDNYSAHVPDVPGCVSTGSSRAEAVAHMREALAFHFEGMREDGLPIPAPRSSASYVSVQP